MYTAFRRLCERCMAVQLREGHEDPSKYPPLRKCYVPEPVRCLSCNIWVEETKRFFFGNGIHYSMYCLNCSRKDFIAH